MSEEEIRSEYAILEKSRKNPDEFGLLYKKYFDRIFGFVYRQTDDEDIAADLTSQTFLNALKNVDKFTFRGVPVSAWFYKIVSNEVNRYYRKKKSTKRALGRNMATVPMRQPRSCQCFPSSLNAIPPAKDAMENTGPGIARTIPIPVTISSL